MVGFRAELVESQVAIVEAPFLRKTLKNQGDSQGIATSVNFGGHSKPINLEVVPPIQTLWDRAISCLWRWCCQALPSCVAGYHMFLEISMIMHRNPWKDAQKLQYIKYEFTATIHYLGIGFDQNPPVWGVLKRNPCVDSTSMPASPALRTDPCNCRALRQWCQWAWLK